MPILGITRKSMAEGIPVPKGFTLIELLITLVLFGLIAALVGPGIDSWLTSLQAAAEGDAVASEVAGLPLIANMRGQRIIISNPAQLSLADLDIQITEPIDVLENGFCLGGSFQLRQGERIRRFKVRPPFCEVERLATE